MWINSVKTDFFLASNDCQLNWLLNGIWCAIICPYLKRVDLLPKQREMKSRIRFEARHGRQDEGRAKRQYLHSSQRIAFENSVWIIRREYLNLSVIFGELEGLSATSEFTASASRLGSSSRELRKLYTSTLGVFLGNIKDPTKCFLIEAGNRKHLGKF